MSLQRSSQLIAPPEEEIIYPYRRAWRSIVIETGILMLVMLVAYVLVQFAGLQIQGLLQLPVNGFLATLPALLWFLFSRWPENAVPQPRRRLATVFIVSALVANAIAVPILYEIIEPERWLALQPALTRIIGYTVTVGIVQEFLKYLVVRYVVWPEYYRRREDSVAYGVASAVGFAMVINLYYVGTNPTAALDAVAIRVFATTSLHIVGSLFVAYGLSETLFSGALSFLLPGTLVAAAFLYGLAIPLRAGFINAPLALTVSSPRSYLGIIFSVIFYVGALSIIYFLLSVAETQERDKRIGQDI